MAGTDDNESGNGWHFLTMEFIFATSMFVGCYLSYLLPIHFLRKRLRVNSSLQLNLDFPNQPSHRSLQQRIEEDASTAERIIGWCNCFGAGIFVSVCFLGVMPVVREEFEAYFSIIELKNVNYPVAELTSLLGFFLVLFLEEIVHSCRSSSSSSSILVNEDDSQSLLFNQTDPMINDSGTSSDTSRLADSAFEDLVIEGNSYHDGRQAHQNRQPRHIHSHSHALPMAGSGFSFFVLMFATSIHSIFEGMALGLIKDPSRAVHIFIGIILHECIVAVALGLNSFRLNEAGSSSGVPKSVNKFGILFASTIPSGMIIGVAVGYTPGALGRLISAIFQGLAAGTFLHVAFCELIPAELSIADSHDHHEELDDKRNSVEGSSHGVREHIPSSSYDNKLFRIILIFLGFVFMAFITLFINHE